MTDVRYAPPVADVADATENRSAVRPRSVTRAVQLFWAAFLVDSVSTFFVADGWTAGAVLSVAAFDLFQAVLIVLVGRGRNWARLVILVLLLLYVTAAIPLMVFGPVRSVRVLTVLSVALYAQATWLLFRHPGRLWFSRAR